MTNLWPAPTATAPVRGHVRVPGSKSIANRALILASLADGPALITGLPAGARDIRLMAAGLTALGAEVAWDDEDRPARVSPGSPIAPASIDCGLAGTVMRFLPPVAALGDGPVMFDGDPRARERPMATIIAGLRAIGVTIDDGGSGRLPFTVIGRGGVDGGDTTVDASSSSQFVSALLLPAARFDNGVTVRHRGATIPSLPHIDMTVRMLLEHRVAVTAEVDDLTDARWTVSPGAVTAFDRVVEPDLSNAAPFAAAALLTGGSIMIRDWPTHGLQPAAPLIDVLTRLGAAFTEQSDGMVVSGTGRINGITAGLRDIGELVPTIAACCAFADGPSRLSGIGHIAGHETDRLRALADELNRLGGDASADQDGLTIRPRPLRGGRWATYHDHRMATAGAIVGLLTPGVMVDNVATTAKTFPGFADLWRRTVAA